MLKRAEQPPTVKIMLGVQLIDREGTNSFNATDRGEQAYDARFKLDSVEDQEKLEELCTKAAAIASVRNGEVLCPIRELALFLERRNRTDEPRVPLKGGAEEIDKWFAEMALCQAPECGAPVFRPKGYAELVRRAKKDRNEVWFSHCVVCDF